MTTINHLNFRERVLHLANVISKLRLPLRCFDDLGDNGKKVNFFSLSFVTLIVFFEMSSFFDVNFVLCLFFLYRLEGTLLYFVALSLVYFPLFLKKIILIEAPNMTSDVALGGELGALGRTNKWRRAVDLKLVLNSSCSLSTFVKSSSPVIMIRYFKLLNGYSHLIMNGLLVPITRDSRDKIQVKTITIYHNKSCVSSYIVSLSSLDRNLSFHLSYT